MSKESISPNPAPKQKKVWQKPDLYVLGTNGVNTGTHAGLHEKSITHSVYVGSGHFILSKTSGGNTLASHTKNWYDS
ncbi:hypothetical protein [Mucilaginibacter sp. UYCu711]|uniref:hypothetical protein n=1 Tax=Mucilaginibacter sp. UYCu711 TaxID=3156339 RepID=UPI003D1A8F80